MPRGARSAGSGPGGGGWSPESRIKQVVSEAKFEAWRQEHYRTRVKLSELEQKQRAVFQEPKPN